jgi:hypothetical protein
MEQFRRLPQLKLVGGVQMSVNALFGSTNKTPTRVYFDFLPVNGEAEQGNGFRGIKLKGKR